MRHNGSEVSLNRDGRIRERRLQVLKVQATWEDTKAQVPRRRKGRERTWIGSSGDTLLEICKVEICDTNFTEMTVAIVRIKIKVGY